MVGRDLGAPVPGEAVGEPGGAGLRRGRGGVELRTIVEEAFASTLVKATRVRVALDHVGIWCADPAADDVCLGRGGGKVTPFDGDGKAGVQAFNTANLLPASALP